MLVLSVIRGTFCFLNQMNHYPFHAHAEFFCAFIGLVLRSESCATVRVMNESRNPRLGVENLWVSRSGQRTKLYGKGKQYRARYIDTSGGNTPGDSSTRPTPRTG